MARVRVATYNAAYYDATKRSDFEQLYKEADIVGFQECGRAEDIRMARSFAEFAVYNSKVPATPIAYRKSMFDFIEGGAFFLSPQSSIDAGAGPPTQKRKYIQWVKLRHKDSGRIIHFGTCHLIPSIYINARYKVHDLQTDNLVKWVKSKPNLVIFVGDFNIDAKKDAHERDPNMPFVKFGRIDVFSTFRALGYPNVGTHGKRFIDYVYYRAAGSRLKPLNHKVITTMSSDHNALVAEFYVSLSALKSLQRRLRNLVGR